jgi:K(+)-stimulated pyrophosphate-energized sodium pump
MNPVIKFTTLFGLLAVELGVYLVGGGNATLSKVLAVAFFLVAVFFVHRSFYGMRIQAEEQPVGAGRPVTVKV